MSLTTNSFLKNNDSDRYTLFPIKYHKLYSYYESQLEVFWTANEIKFNEDLTDWNTKLTDNEKYFIKHILAFFAASDGVVNENLILNFYNEVQIPEARAFYTVQLMIESIHSQTYSLLIDTYISDKTEKMELFKAMETIPCIKKKTDWAIKWISGGMCTLPDILQEKLSNLKSINLNVGKYLNNDEKDTIDYLTKSRPSFAQRLLAFICVEGIMFSGSFCALYWLKSRGLMNALSTANEFIARDENSHCEFAITLYNMLEDPLSVDIAHSIFKEAVDIEKEFITSSLPVSLIGMNCTLMSEYIEHVANRWLVILNYPKLYPDAKNPFSFMEMIGMSSKTNFFEVLNTSYTKNTLVDNEVSFDSEF